MASRSADVQINGAQSKYDLKNMTLKDFKSLLQQYRISKVHLVSKTHASLCCRAPVIITRRMGWLKPRYRCMSCYKMAGPLNISQLPVKQQFNIDAFVAELQLELGAKAKTNSKQAADHTGYPKAYADTKPNELGVILDHADTPLELSRTVDLPNGLKWATIDSLESFAKVLERGIPAFVVFGDVSGKLASKKWNALDCAKMFVKACKQHELKKLPPVVCTNSMQTVRDAIDMLFLDYL